MKLDLQVAAGKTIFVGIDVHKATYTLAVVCDGETILKVGSMPAEPQGIIDFLKKRFPHSTIRSAYEAGFSGFVLHRAFVHAGIDNLVVHAAAIQVAANDRVKTDKRDAIKIALQLSRSMLKGIRVPTPEEEQKRQLTRTRAQLIAERTRLGNQIKSKLMLFGWISASDERRMSSKLLTEFKSLKLPVELAIAVSALTEVWQKINEQIKELENEIELQAKRDVTLEQIYRSAPGFGSISSRTFANEIGNMSQFSNEGKAFSFFGLTPSEYSSGPHERKGRITRQGPAHLRSLIVEAAWRAKRQDPELEAIYQRIKVRRGGRRAIVAVARRLVGRIRTCLQQNIHYEINRNNKAA